MDADKNIPSDSADNPLDPDSQIEEVIIEKEVKSQIPPEDITEVRKNEFISFTFYKFYKINFLNQISVN